MFDKLVVSAARRRAGRTVNFFVYTAVTYLLVLAAAFSLSILLAEPKLADASIWSIRIAPSPPPGPRAANRGERHREELGSLRQDPNHVMKYEDIVRDQQNSPPRVKLPSGPDLGPLTGIGATGGDPNLGPGIGLGVIAADARASDPSAGAPDPPKPETRPVDTRKPLPVSSVVLQGKAIERVVPAYPELPKRIRLQGEVSLEVIISPEGRVESVRVVSGHPLLIGSAREAARGWRFEPTYLNGVPVRVTGVITFVFKLDK